MKKVNIFKIIVAGVAFSISNQVFAIASYCSTTNDGTNAQSTPSIEVFKKNGDSAGFFQLSIKDLTFAGRDADDCFFDSINNDSLTNIRNIQDNNGINWDDDSHDWDLAGKSDTPDIYTLFNNSFSFSVTANNNQTSGDWTLNWTDMNPSLAPNLPFKIDLIGVLKGGSNGYAAYIFQGILLEDNGTANDNQGSGTGSFQIKVLNGGGQVPGLSHLDIYVRQAETSTTLTGGIPEPSILTLLGIGLLGLGGMNMRHRWASLKA
ncbi:MAG: PEP-CTERM sorting domain-containing protein [Gammaproteobacteria bacterium]|nr:PEP-CTERM sorting domain-containing protein [Gammaproteobacteria bacterium]